MRVQDHTECFTPKISTQLGSINADLLMCITDIYSSLKNFPVEIRSVISSLVNIGWFPSGEMGFSEIYAFRSLLEPIDNSAVDAAMIEWLQEELVHIQERAMNRFPNRAHILASAFKAHDAGEYNLSIPVLMAQVDGMCLEVLKGKLFSMKNGNPLTRELTDKFSQFSLSDALLLPLRQPHGFTASKHIRQQWPDTPNRHEILHGIATDYGTYKNSFKTISLIEYFTTFIVPRFDRAK